MILIFDTNTVDFCQFTAYITDWWIANPSCFFLCIRATCLLPL